MSESKAGHPGAPGAQDVLSGDHRSAHLLAENVHCALGDRLVLRDVSLKVSRGERVGLIGENGRGKSTLLRALAGELPLQRGQVVRAVAGQVGFLPQQPGFPAGATIATVLARATAEFGDMAERMRAAEELMSSDYDDAGCDVASYDDAGCDGSGKGDSGKGDSSKDDLRDVLSEYGRLQDEFARRGGWELDARVGEVLDVFGLGGLDRLRPTETLSGGERSRLALAGLVLTEPAGLLLDEPTNHLDDRAVDWLVQWLAQYQGPCLIASHDRLLLDTAVTAIVDLDGSRGSTVRYGGGYRDYLDERAADQARWWQEYRDWRQELAETKRRLERAGRSGRTFGGMRDSDKLSYNLAGGGAQAAAARATRAARQHLGRLLDEEVQRPPEPLAFRPPESEGAELSDGVLLRAEGLVVGDVVRGVDLELAPGSLHVITGANGAGKSTLLSVLAGLRAPDAGAVVREPGLRIGYLPQESHFSQEQRGVLDAFAAHRAAYVDDAARELTRFGLFGTAEFDVPVNRLSVGQLRRLELALLFSRRPHLLLLDEPSNHLSLALVEQLQEAVEQFTGPVVMVTHDRVLRERHQDSLLELAEGRLVQRA